MRIENKKKTEKINNHQSQQKEIDILKQEVRKINLKSKIVEAYKQGLMEWAENNPGKVHPLQIAKADLGKAKGMDEIVEHFLLEHDGNIDGLRERFANGKITIEDN